MTPANQLPCTWCQDYYFMRASTAKVFKELFCSDKCEDKYELSEELRRNHHARESAKR